MNPTLKRIIAVIAGTVTAIIIIFLLEMVNSNFYQPPADFNPKSMEDVKAMMASMPASAYILVVLGYLLGSFFGGLIASLISGKEKANASVIVGAVLLVGGILNLMMLPGQPMWFIVSSTLIYIPFSYLGYLTVRKKN